MEQTSKIYVIMMLTFEVKDKNGIIRNFLGQKPLMAYKNKESADKTIEYFRKSEDENRKSFKDVYHLEFDYIIQEITLY